MQNDMNVEQPHSVWLCPEDTAYSDFQSIIDDIAQQQGTAPFAPHVTLLGDINGPPRETVAFCRQLFAQQTAAQAKSRGLAVTNRFFMSLFVDLDLPSHVFELRSSLASALGLDAAEGFRPHLSLAYGLEGDEQTQHFARTSPLVSQGKQFFLDSVVIAASSSCLPISNWKTLYKIEIARD